MRSMTKSAWSQRRLKHFPFTLADLSFPIGGLTASVLSLPANPFSVWGLSLRQKCIHKKCRRGPC